MPLQAPSLPRDVVALRLRRARFAAGPVLLAACASGQAAPAGGGAAFDAGRAWSHLEAIVALGERPAGSPAIERLRTYLERDLAGLGLSPRREAFEAQTPVGVVEFANVHATAEGRRTDGAEPPIVVLATHIDTKRLPFEFVGANDAGSGTAVLLELARCLTAEKGGRPVTYRFVFLDGEESFRPHWSGKDNRYGSRHHVEQLRRAGALERVGACVLLDMVGDRDLRLTRELYSDPELTSIFFEAARRIGLGRHVGAAARELRDDHQSFLAAGIPSVDLIDFEYGPDNELWHSADDTLAHCSRESLDAIGRIVLAGLPRVEAFVLERRVGGSRRVDRR